MELKLELKLEMKLKQELGQLADLCQEKEMILILVGMEGKMIRWRLEP